MVRYGIVGFGLHEAAGVLRQGCDRKGRETDVFAQALENEPRLVGHREFLRRHNSGQQKDRRDNKRQFPQRLGSLSWGNFWAPYSQIGQRYYRELRRRAR